MSQLEIIKYRDLIEIRDIPRFVAGADEPTIEVRGEDFSSVEKVFINEAEVLQYTIVNRTQMLVVVPSNVDPNTLRTVEVISSNFTKTKTASKVTFAVGEQPKVVSGVMALVQLYTKWLLQTPGSDIFNPNRGGGLLGLIGQLISLNQTDHLLTSVTRAVQTTTQQIQVSQTQASQIPADQRLLDGSLVDVNINPYQSAAYVRVLITSTSGDTAVNSLVL